MRPKTEFQKKVVAISRQLPSITNNQLYAFVNNIEYPAFHDNKGYTCSACGHQFSSEEEFCPHCHRQLHYDAYYENKRTIKDQYFYQGLVLHRQGITITRNFLLKGTFYKQGGYTISWSEILQSYYADGQFEVMAAKRNALGHYTYESQWVFDSELTLKSDTRQDAYRYPILCAVYHGKNYIPQLEYVSSNAIQLTAHYKHSTSKAVRCCSQLETIHKQQPQFFRYFLTDTHSLIQYWPTFKIAFRRKFEFPHIQQYLNYLFFLRRLNYDLRNPQYVAPANFEEAMNRVRTDYCQWLIVHNPAAAQAELRRNQALQNQEELKKQFEQEVKDYETRYAEEHSKWLDLVIKANKLTIKPLQSVQEFADEGAAMHHCVYSNKYWKKPDTLILSARIGDKRIETIEVNTATFDIIQSRGVCNKTTTYHDAIIKAVESYFRKVA